MRILVSLALALVLIAALVVGITLLAATLARSAGKTFEQGPMKSGFVPRVAFAVLWVLVFGVSLGLIGAS